MDSINFVAILNSAIKCDHLGWAGTAWWGGSDQQEDVGIQNKSVVSLNKYSFYNDMVL